MRLLLDEMLKKTAKWLRIFGIDTEFIEGKTDSDLLAYAINNKLIFITKDEELANKCKKQNTAYLLLKSEKLTDQLREIKNLLGLEFKFPEETRCPNCNTRLKTIEKSEIAEIVHENVLKLHKEFWLCDKCKKVYWEGGHWKNIMRIFEKVSV